MFHRYSALIAQAKQETRSGSAAGFMEEEGRKSGFQTERLQELLSVLKEDLQVHGH